MEKISRAAAGADSNPAQTAERELKIEICPRGWVRWRGTRAQLEAEGLIEPGLVWPSRTAYSNWVKGEFHFHLNRCRPDGLKGSMKLWTNGDYWCVERSLNDSRRGTFVEINLYEKRKALERALWRESPAGRAQSSLWARAYKDANFQAFIALIPALNPPKRGRKPSTASTVKG